MTFVMKIKRGRTFQAPLNYKANGVGVDLTGKSFVFHLRKGGAKTDYLTLAAGAAANANGSQLTWVAQSSGQMQLKLSATETAAMNFIDGDYSFSLEYGGDIFDIDIETPTLVKIVDP